jgi:hypothetical protein
MKQYRNKFVSGVRIHLIRAGVISGSEGTESFYLNLSNPVNATISDSQGVGTITQGGGGGGLITPVVSAYATSGVAPQAVFFDATGTTATSLTSRPFHDLEYRWDFGDGGVSTWSYGAQPGVLLKNVAFGPTAAHVYETAGTFTPTLTVRSRNSDGTYITATQAQPSITVITADARWSTTKTVCINPTGDTDFTGAPSGATQYNIVTTANAAVAANIGSGDKRILFKRGGTYDISVAATINQPGPGLIGAYGSGAKPILQSTIGVANNGMFRLSTNATPTGVSDWRFQDLTVNGISGAIGIANASTAFYGDGSCSKILLHRVDMQNVYYGVLMSGSNLDSYNSASPYPSNPHAMWDEIYVVDSSIYNLTPGNGPNAIFADAKRGVVMGTLIDNNGGGEHGIRFQLLERGVLSNNSIQNTAVGKTNLTVRGTNFAGTNTNPAGMYSEKIVISGNKFIGGVGFGPQNEFSDERGRNLILECNWWALGSTLNQAFGTNQPDVTIRNNFVYVPGNNGGNAFMAKPENQVLGVTVPTRVSVYNNTVYHAGTAADYALFQVLSNLGNLLPDSNFDVRNNILYAPNITTPVVATNNPYATSTITQSNNSVNPKTNPLFAALPTLTLADFAVQPGSYAIGAGADVAVCSDFYRQNIHEPSDIGAVANNIESIYRDSIPTIVSIPLVGTPISYTSARLPGSPAATATRIRVAGVTVASGTTTASYSPVLADAAKMLTVEVDYGATATVSMPMPILSDEWMVPTPVIRDAGIALTSDSQPGTNIYYIDPVGGVGPNLIQAYGWNGTNIIDSTGSTTGAGGVAYGTDPLNPSGPVVAGKHSTAVFLDRYGNLPGVRNGFGSGYGPGEAEYSGTSNRRGSSQWYLIKRGTTLDLTDDLADYKAACTSLGADCQYTYSGLATHGGTSWAARQVIGAYGPLATARPIITQRAGVAAGAIVARNASGYAESGWSNVQYMDLVFNGKIRNGLVDPVYGFSFIGGAIGANVWATGCLITGCMNNPVQGAERQFMFYRSMITDVFKNPGPGHSQGIFSSGANRNGKMQLLESFMAHNGFKCDPARIRDGWDSIPVFSPASSYGLQDLVIAPDGKAWLSVSANSAAAWTGGPYAENTGWMLAGVNRQPVAADVFCRNNYWSAGMSPTESFAIRCVLLPGATGEQISRAGSRVESNLMLTGYSSQGGGGGYAGTSASGGVIDNVIFPYADGGQNPGWGTGLSMGAGYTRVARNIVSRQATTGGASFTLAAVAWETSGFVYSYPVRNNLIEFNIFDSGSATPLGVEDGYRTAVYSASDVTNNPQRAAETLATRTNYGAGPGVLNNSMSNNWLITSNVAFSSYTPSPGSPATDITNTTATGNVTYATRAAAATALGGVDSTRSIRTYLTSIGQTVPVTDIYGVNTWISLWELQRRGNWNTAITAVPAINYVRAGFGMQSLSA